MQRSLVADDAPSVQPRSRTSVRRRSARARTEQPSVAQAGDGRRSIRKRTTPRARTPSSHPDGHADRLQPSVDIEARDARESHAHASPRPCGNGTSDASAAASPAAPRPGAPRRLRRADALVERSLRSTRRAPRRRRGPPTTQPGSAACARLFLARRTRRHAASEPDGSAFGPCAHRLPPWTDGHAASGLTGQRSENRLHCLPPSVARTGLDTGPHRTARGVTPHEGLDDLPARRARARSSLRSPPTGRIQHLHRELGAGGERRPVLR